MQTTVIIERLLRGWGWGWNDEKERKEERILVTEEWNRR